METKILYNLFLASQELKSAAEHGRQVKTLRPSGCRISDGLIAQYEQTASEIDNLLARFPGVVENYIEGQKKAISETLGLPYMTDAELAC